MKAINYKKFLFLILCLTLLPGIKLYAQNSVFFESLKNKNYLPIKLKLSENEEWISFFKYYNTSQDSVVILNREKIDKPLTVRGNVKKIEFNSANQAIVIQDSIVEVLNLQNLKSKIYSNAIQSDFLNKRNQYVIQYSQLKDNKLELREMNGKLINSVKNVNRYFITEKENVFILTQNPQGVFEIIKLENKNQETLFSSLKPIDDIQIDSNERGMMVIFKDGENEFQNISYLNLESGVIHNLNQELGFHPFGSIVQPVIEGKSYFLRIFKKEEGGNDIVDIWNGNDYQLNEKFKNNIRELNYMWYPEEKKVVKMGLSMGSQSLPLGKNGLYLYFNPHELEDYTQENKLLNVYIVNPNENTSEFLDTINSIFFVSPSGLFIIASKNNKWILYDIVNKEKHTIEKENLGKPFFSENNLFVYFESGDGLWRYDIVNHSIYSLESFINQEVTFINAKSKSILNGYNIFENSVDTQNPLIIKLKNSIDNKNAIVKYQDGKITCISHPTADNIHSLISGKNYENHVYFKENFNKPPTLYYKKEGKKECVVFETNKNDEKIKQLRQLITVYEDADGNKLNGVLFFPFKYNENLKYPMVVHVYKEQSNKRNRYPVFEYANGVGFDVRALLEKGYFVYLPDNRIGEKGPGISSLISIENSLKAINLEAINRDKIALIGHSFGGYVTNFIATHSDLFATYISSAGKSDLIHSYYSFNYSFLFPEYQRIESPVYNLKQSFSENKSLYVNNNPIYFAEKVKKPILIWTGKEDQNVPMSGSMGFYLALKRNRKKVIALFYPEEAHIIQNYPKQKDLYVRILDWLDYFLNDQKDKPWINKEMKEDAPF